MNKRQKWQVILTILFAGLFILLLFEPGWRIPKILGLIANALLFLSMFISHQAEQKNKDNPDK